MQPGRTPLRRSARRASSPPESSNPSRFRSGRPRPAAPSPVISTARKRGRTVDAEGEAPAPHRSGNSRNAASSSALKRLRPAQDEVDPAAPPFASKTRRSKAAQAPVEDSEDADGMSRRWSFRLLGYSKPKLVHDTLCSLSAPAMELVKEVGLGGMLEVPRILLMDRQFSFWLLSRICTRTMTLELGNGDFISLSEKSVELVLGVSGEGNEIAPAAKNFDRNVDPAVARILQLPEGTKHIRPEDLTEVLRRELPDNASEEDKDMIRAAAVLFCCTHLLGPRDRTAVIPREILTCAMHPRTLKFYNWARYILGIIRESATKLKQDLADEHTNLFLSGCMLYLQVYYLDSIDFGNHNVQSNGYPRVAYYTKEKLKQLIELDKANDPCPVNITFGKTQHTRKDSPSNPRGTLGRAELARRALEAKEARARSTPQVNEPSQTAEQILSKSVMIQIDNVASKCKTWIKEVAEEIQSANASKFVEVDRAIRLKLEALELRINTSSEDLKREVLRALSIYTKPNTSVSYHPQNPGCATTSATSAPRSKTDKENQSSEIRPPLPTKQRMNQPNIATQSTTLPKPNEKNIPSTSTHRMVREDNPSRSQSSANNNNKTSTTALNTEQAIYTDNATLEPCSSPLKTIGMRKNVKRTAGRFTNSRRDYTSPTRDKPFKARVKVMARKPSKAKKLDGQQQLQDTPHPAVKLNHSFAEQFFKTRRWMMDDILTGTKAQHPMESYRVDARTANTEGSGPGLKCGALTSSEAIHPHNELHADHEPADIASPCMPRSNSNKEIILQHTPEVLSVLRTRRVVHPMPYSKSPFKLGLTWPPIPEHVLDLFYEQALSCSSSELNRNWIAHDTPTVISVTGKKLVDHMGPQENLPAMPIDIGSALFRMLHLVENKVYARSNSARWRHFLPPEWTVAILKGTDYSSSPSVQEMFTSETFSFHVEHCRVIIAPVIVAGWWACYIWDFGRKELHVLDPVLSKSSFDIQDKHHADTLSLLHNGLFGCLHSFFNGWNVSSSGWNANFYSYLHDPCTKPESGYYAAYYAMMFNGVKFRRSIFKDQHCRVKKELLYRLVTTPGNQSRLPSFMLQNIED